MLYIVLVLLARAVECHAYVVDGSTGSDDNTGLGEEEAFLTIGRCVQELRHPGDQCLIRAGRYHEVVEVESIRGTTDNPIVVKGYGDEWPVWDGGVVIQPESWEKDASTGICSAEISEDIFALFLDDELLTAARWPNALWSDKTVFDNSHWRPCDKASTHGNIVDKTLAEAGVDVTGAMAVLNVGSFDTWVREVLEHEAGSDNFTYNHDFGDNIHWRPNHNQYYLEAALALLDAPSEWFYDASTKVLHVIPPEGLDCQDLKTLKGRTMDYGLTITNTTGFTIANIIFHAANILAEGSGDKAVRDIKLDSLHVRFGSSSHRMLKDPSAPRSTKVLAGTKHSHPGMITVTNCSFSGAEGPALSYTGTGTVVTNNLFSYNDWTGQGEGGTVMSSAAQGDFSYNTLWYNGAAHGFRYTGRHSVMRNNYMVGQCWGNIQSDGASMQMSTGAQNGVTLSHNWVHDSPKKGLRFDGNGDPMGLHGYQGYNVVWNIRGNNEMYVKGDNHTVVNNVAYDGDSQCSLCVVPKLGHHPMNNNSLVTNNAASKMAGGGGLVENNYEGADVKTHMEDPDNHDFRPVDGGPFTQGNNIIGPYLPGLGNLSYSIPGRREYKTSHPIPISGARVPASRDVVMCREGFLANIHHFYFGTRSSAVEAAGMDDEEFQYSLDEGNIFQLPVLEPDNQYFWRVDTQREEDIFKGDVWTFHT